MTAKRSLASTVSALIGVTSRASNQIAAIAVVLVAARFLGPSDFGVFALASAFVTFVRGTLYSGGYEYLLKTKDAEDAAECLAINAGVATALTLGLFLLSMAAGPIFGSESVGRLLAAMAPSNLISAFAAWQEALVLRRKRIRAYYAVTTGVEIVSAGIAVLMLLTGRGLDALVVQIYVRAVLSIGAYLALMRPPVSLSLRIAVMRRIAAWSMTRYGAVSISFLYQYAADILLGAFLSPAAVGLYRAANRIVTAVSDLFAHPAGLFGTTLFSARAASGQSSADLWPQLLTASAFLGWSVLAGLAAAAQSFVLLALGPQWEPAAALIPILCLARAAQILAAATIPLLVAYDRNGAVLIIQAGAAALVIGALCLAAPRGVEPTAITVVIVSLLASSAYVGLAAALLPGSLHRLLQNLPLVLLPALATAAASAVTQGLLTGAGMQAAPAVLLTTAAGALVWGLFLLLFRARIAEALSALSL